MNQQAQQQRQLVHGRSTGEPPVLNAAGWQDAIGFATLVREAGIEGVAVFLAGLESGRKDALLVALACAVDVERTSGQWWGWLGGQQPVVHPVPSVPLAAEVVRFARDHDLSADQVWRAIVNLHSASAHGVAQSCSGLGAVSR